MLEDVTKRLETFGYTVTENDEWLIGFIIRKVDNHIKLECNIKEIPQELNEIIVDMAVGEFLLEKKSMGELAGFNLDAVVKSIQEGDTNLTYAIGEGSNTPEQRLDGLIAYLMEYGKNKLVSYRCIKW